jgi:ascorbate-specific PTS system EIIC-type component UlaA
MMLLVKKVYSKDQLSISHFQMERLFLSCWSGKVAKKTGKTEKQKKGTNIAIIDCRADNKGFLCYTNKDWPELPILFK